MNALRKQTTVMSRQIVLTQKVHLPVLVTQAILVMASTARVSHGIKQYNGRNYQICFAITHGSD